jgi:hypothetical protein
MIIYNNRNSRKIHSPNKQNIGYQNTIPETTKCIPTPTPIPSSKQFY